MQGRRGFNIIEFAIAIAIVGIMLAFGLKGRVVIELMKGTVLAFDLRFYQTTVQHYLEDFRELPGDGLGGEKMWRRAPALSVLSSGAEASKAGNHVIDGEFYRFGNAAGEQFVAWQDLRYAGLVEGDPKLAGASAMPENPFGGFVGFDEGNLGQQGGSICASKVPGRAAELIDKRLDDGRIDTGMVVATSKFSIEANNHFDAPDKQPYDIEKEYIICLPLMP